MLYCVIARKPHDTKAETFIVGRQFVNVSDAARAKFELGKQYGDVTILGVPSATVFDWRTDMSKTVADAVSGFDSDVPAGFFR